MGTRTARFDEEAEKTLSRLRSFTGLSISEVLKRGSSAYEIQAQKQVNRKPYDVSRKLGLGAGGYAIALAREAKSAVANAMRKKHKR